MIHKYFSKEEESEKLPIVLLKKKNNLIPTLMDDFERVRSSGKEVTADMIERARKPELEVDPKDVTELLQSYDKTFNR